VSPATPAALHLIAGKVGRRPPLPATAISRAVARLRLRPHHPADSRCPLTPRCSPRGRADGRGHRPVGDL